MNKITFHNKINPQYREIHIDGAYGGITSRGLINLNFYAERSPIPKATDMDIDQSGKIISLKDSPDSKVGILREFEFGIYMDIKTAEELSVYLQQKIKELKAN